MSLSDRIRLDCEAAPWVIEEVKQLETKLAAAAEKKVAELMKQRGDSMIRAAMIRAEKADAELAAEKKRMDWLEAHALAQHSHSVGITDLGRHYNGFPGSFRAAIDTAMKEGALQKCAAHLTAERTRDREENRRLCSPVE